MLKVLCQICTPFVIQKINFNRSSSNFTIDSPRPLRNSHARNRFFLIFRLFTKFSEFSDTRIVFSRWFFIRNDVLDIIFRAHEIFIGRVSHGAENARSPMYFLWDGARKTYFLNGPLLGKSTKIFVIYTLENIKYNGFYPGL